MAVRSFAVQAARLETELVREAERRTHAAAVAAAPGQDGELSAS